MKQDEQNKQDLSFSPLKLILGVCGSISAYKSLDLTRELTKQGHQVIVVLTKTAQNFVLPDVFSYLGAKAVFLFDDDFKPHVYRQYFSGNVLHIDLANWTDQILIAPTTCNTLNKLAAGICDDLLTCLFMATPTNTPILLFPAMNTKMYHHHHTKISIDKLNQMQNIFILPTKKGELVCGDVGNGKLLDVEHIVELSCILWPIKNLKNKLNILISTGATLSPIDPVRYLTNPSSGLTGFFLAKKYLSYGHTVTVIAGKYSTQKLDTISNHPNYKLIRITTTKEMREKVLDYFKRCDYYISSAAICDIEFLYVDEKIKKETLKMTLPFIKAPDILAEVIKIKKSHQKIIGFAAETNLTEKNLLKKSKQKPVDLLVGTYVNSGVDKNVPPVGFQNPQANYFILKGAQNIFSGNLDKKQLAHKIYQATLS